MKDINIITLQDLDDAHFDTTNSDGSNKIKLKPRDNSLGGVSLTGLPVESSNHKDWLVLHKGKLALSTPTWLQDGPDLRVEIREGSGAPRPYVSSGRTVYTQFMNVAVTADRDVSSCTLTVTGLDQDGATFVGSPGVFAPPGARAVATSGHKAWTITNLPAGKELLLTYRFKCTKPADFTFTATAALGGGLGNDPNPSNNTATYTINISEFGGADTVPFSVTDVATGEDLLISEFRDGSANIAKNRLNVYGELYSLKGRQFKITGSNEVRVYKVSPNNTTHDRSVTHFPIYSPVSSRMFSPMAVSFLRGDGDVEVTRRIAQHGRSVPGYTLASSDEVTFDARTGILTFKTDAQDPASPCGTLMYVLDPADVKERNDNDPTKANPYVVITIAKRSDATEDVGCTIRTQQKDLPVGCKLFSGDFGDFVNKEVGIPTEFDKRPVKWIGSKAIPGLLMALSPDGPQLCPSVGFMSEGYDNYQSTLITVPPGGEYQFKVLANSCDYFSLFRNYSIRQSGKPGIDIAGRNTECKVYIENPEPGTFCWCGPLCVVCVEP